MLHRRFLQRAPQVLRQSKTCSRRRLAVSHPMRFMNTSQRSSMASSHLPIMRSFHTSGSVRAQPTTADSLMDNLTDLYSTAKDEFEIAAEETEKKTVYAADDREAAKEAFNVLKEAYDRAIRESNPEVAKEIQARTGTKIKELENALTAVEEMAMED